MAGLTWKVAEVVMAAADPTYVEYKRFEAFSNTKRIATVHFHYGDDNSANSSRGSISMARVTGKFTKTWIRRGYTWQNNYVPACQSESEATDWVETKWTAWLKAAGL